MINKIMKKHIIILVLFIYWTSISTLNAQFTIVNTLKTTDNSGLKIGDNAYLTAAKGIDPNGSGYLRLTEATTNQKGFMYVMQSFPTSLGIIADFEYKAWRNVADNTYFGADGFTVFLFDGSVTDANFHLGGYGGSLGYATFSNPTGTLGLSGGYVGIGFDAYGNYAAPTESRNGGPGILPNAIVLRGPTSPTYSNSNIYLASAALGDRTGGDNAIRQRNEIDYNTTTATRPTDNVFYRRVQVSISKVSGNYVVSVKWRKQNETIFTEVLNYTMNSATYPLPSTLKLGFAGSTGGGFNNQEIRNILLTTPGNLRVDSRTSTSFTCNEKKTPVTFTIEVTNDTPATLSSINFNSKITNSSNTVLTSNQFKITSITTTGFTNSTIPTTSNTNQISGVVGLPANKSGIVTITGEYYKGGIKTNDKFLSTSTVSSTEITDSDETNNISTTEVLVRKCMLISNPVLPSYAK